MRVLVADTSVLVDLERGSLLEASFRLPFQLAVPDLLYERELHDGLTAISRHPRCRLPRAEIRRRLAFYAEALSKT